MKINYKAEGAERKKLVEAIAEITGCEAVYLKTPTYAYRIGEYTVDRDGALAFDDDLDSTEVVYRLREKGFDVDLDAENTTASENISENGLELVPEEDELGLCISYPRSKISDGGIERLKKLLEAKGNLIRKALGVSELPVEEDDEKLSFPWFSKLPEPEEVNAYSRFIYALCSFAENQKRVTAKEKAVENEKFAFRTFLLRLGFIGDEPELKKARKILLSKLSGSSAFKSGKKAETAVSTPEVNENVNEEEAPARPQNPQVKDDIRAAINEEDEADEISG